MPQSGPREPDDLHFTQLMADKTTSVEHCRVRARWKVLLITDDGRRAYVEGFEGESFDTVLDRAIERIRQQTVAA